MSLPGYQKWLRGIIFLALFSLLFALASQIFIIKPTVGNDSFSRMKTFYQQPNHSLDVLYIGASTLRNGISPLEIWGQYGFTGYTLSTGYQNPLVNYYYLLEALKYQQPDVVVLDGSWLLKPVNVDAQESFLRLAVDPMRLSIEKLLLIREIVEKSSFQTASSYLFPLLRYHNRWKELSEKDWDIFRFQPTDRYKGQLLIYESEAVKLPVEAYQPTDQSSRIDDEARSYYLKFIRHCREKGIAVVLINAPRVGWNMKMHNAVQEFADRFGLPFIDYSMPDKIREIGLDPATDFHDEEHLNFMGAKKVSLHLGAYLKEMYHLPDRRNDLDFLSWNEDLAIYQQKTGGK